MGTPFIFSPSETGGGGGKDSEVVVGEEAVLVLRDTDLEAVVEEPDEELS